jgi:hypothetical protein
MKKLLFLLLLLTAEIVSAQKVNFKGDTLFKDSIPYAILMNSVNGFTLKEISGREIASITDRYHVSQSEPRTINEKFWLIDFYTQELIGQCEVKAIGKQQLAELIVKVNLFENGILNVHAARYFIRQHKTKPKK